MSTYCSPKTGQIMTVEADLPDFFRAVGIATKTLRVMKLTAIFLLVGCLAVSARGRAQERVTLHLKGVSLETVLEKIQEQTGYTYVYSAKDVPVMKKFDINVTGATVGEVLDLCLKGLPVRYEIIGRLIKIIPSGSTPLAEVNVPSPDAYDVVISVSSEDGVKMAGATVKIPAVRFVGETDEMGRLVAKAVPKGRYEVEVTYVGYQLYQTSVEVAGKAVNLPIMLKHAANHLDEVQIIAYGQTTQRLSTGDVTKVNSTDIVQQPVVNPLAALEGRVPGMFITQGSGMPGSPYVVQIRGLNSIFNGNDPFYVIDGVPYSSELLQSANPASGINGGGYGSPLNFLNPADIESISILKDADATAIYGSRAANGAILITTKKGRVGNARLIINVSGGVGKAPMKVNWLNTNQYLSMRNEAFANDSMQPNQSSAPDLLLWDTTRNTDWQKYFVGGRAIYNDVQGSISGGNTNTQYLFGGSYHNETTVFPGNWYDKKGSFHFNVASNSNDGRFKAIINGNYNLDYSNLPTTDPTYNLKMPPDAPSIYNNDGTLNYAGYSLVYANNPVAFSIRQYLAHTNNLIANGAFSYTIIKNLDAKVNVGYNNLQLNETSTFPIASQDPAYNPTGSCVFVNNNIHSWIAEPQVTYLVLLGLSKVGALVGGTFNDIASNGQVLSGYGYTSDGLLTDLQAAPQISAQSITNSEYKYSAIFGRLNYNYDDKYLADFTVRRDGSSRFGPENEFHDFGSVGAAWIFSNLQCIQKSLKFLSFGKLKGSYGTTGNDQIGDYRYYNLFNTTYYPYQGQIGLTPSSLYNPTLSWESTRKAEGAISLGFFNNRVVLDGDYFVNRSSNELVLSPLPGVTGFSYVTENLPATVQNSGWEGVLNTVNIKSKNFTWRSSFNITKTKNILKAYPGLAVSPYASQFVIGQSVTIKEVFRSTGVDPATGIYSFLDSKGSQTFNPSYTTDRAGLVNTDPKFYGGFQNSFTYVGIQLDILFQFIKQTGVNPQFQESSTPGFLGNNMPAVVLDRWQAPGEMKPVEKYTQNYGSFAWNAYTNAQMSNLNYTDASFIRLKNVSLSWELPRGMLAKIHLQNVKVYVHGQNLWTITKYKGTDPEIQSLSTLPPLGVFVGGIQLSL